MKNIICLRSYTDASLGQVVNLLVTNGYNVSVSIHDNTKLQLEFEKEGEAIAFKSVLSDIVDKMEELQYLEELTTDVDEPSMNVSDAIRQCINIVNQHIRN